MCGKSSGVFPDLFIYFLFVDASLDLSCPNECVTKIFNKIDKNLKFERFNIILLLNCLLKKEEKFEYIAITLENFKFHISNCSSIPFLI